jgi:hypothetical protein
MNDLCTNCRRPIPEVVDGTWRSALPRPTTCHMGCKTMACWSCHEPLSAENSSPSVLEHRSGRCRACDTKYNNELNTALKLEVFTHYCSGDLRCQCPGCRTTQLCFLTMDHIAGDGASHKTPNGKARLLGKALYYWLRRQGYPAGFQVLCFNCNNAKRRGLTCPCAGQDH